MEVWCGGHSKRGISCFGSNRRMFQRRQQCSQPAAYAKLMLLRASRAALLHGHTKTSMQHASRFLSPSTHTCAAASGSMPSADSSPRSRASSAGSCCAAAMRSDGST